MKGLLRATGESGWEVQQERAPRSWERLRAKTGPGGPPREHRAAHLLSTPATVGAKGPEGPWAESPGF